LLATVLRAEIQSEGLACLAQIAVGKAGHGQDRARVHPSRRRASQGSSGRGLIDDIETLFDLIDFTVDPLGPMPSA
jgi:hypothetical protein